MFKIITSLAWLFDPYLKNKTTIDASLAHSSPNVKIQIIHMCSLCTPQKQQQQQQKPKTKTKKQANNNNNNKKTELI